MATAWNRSQPLDTSDRAFIYMRGLTERHNDAGFPAQRFSEPDKLGTAFAFLRSAQAGYITGQHLLIDDCVFSGTFWPKSSSPPRTSSGHANVSGGLLRAQFREACVSGGTARP